MCLQKKLRAVQQDRQCLNNTCLYSHHIHVQRPPSWGPRGCINRTVILFFVPGRVNLTSIYRVCLSGPVCVCVCVYWWHWTELQHTVPFSEDVNMYFVIVQPWIIFGEHVGVNARTCQDYKIRRDTFFFFLSQLISIHTRSHLVDNVYVQRLAGIKLGYAMLRYAYVERSSVCFWGANSYCI